VRNINPEDEYKNRATEAALDFLLLAAN
jgi:hypothetical protein